MATPLPPARTSFVGRENELAALAGLVARGQRLVTVTGPAGIGKTRLVGAFLERLPCTGERWFCDLSEAHTLGDVLGAVAAALRVSLGSEDGPTAAADRVGAALASRGAAVVALDNFEQVAALAPATLGRWLDAAPAVRFVVTSRERLHLAGEAMLELDPLPTREAAALFRARAGLVRPGYEAELGGDEARAVRELVERLDGNPLAIELAAARAGTLSAADLLNRLGQRFEILRSTRRDAPARQLSLRAALDGSWDLLAADERAALSQCAVFRGGFSLAAAESVLSPGGARAIDLVHALRDKSLVRAEPVPGASSSTVRFRLYESVRAYALERFASADERTRVQERHARYFAAAGARLAREAHGPDGLAVLRELALERDNLLAVARGEHGDDPAACVGAACALDPLLSFRAPFDLHREVMDLARERARAVAGTLLESDALVAWSRVWLVRGRCEGCAESLSRAAHIARDAGDSERETYARVLWGYALNAAGDTAGARAELERALDLARRGGHVRHEGSARMYLGWVSAREGDFAAASALNEAAAALFRACGARRYVAIALANQARALGLQGRSAEGLARLEDATVLFAQHGDEVHRAKMHARSAALLRDLGRVVEARARAERALADGRALGDAVCQAEALLELGWLDLSAGAVETARARVQDATLVARGGVWAETLREIAALEEACARAGTLPAPGGDAAELEVSADGRWFRRGSKRTDLSRRASLRLILLALVEARAGHAGQGVKLEALVAAGWPRQKLLPGSGATRVYTAVRSLRAMGLEGVLQTRDDGYLLDPRVPLRWPAAG